MGVAAPATAAFAPAVESAGRRSKSSASRCRLFFAARLSPGLSELLLSRRRRGGPCADSPIPLRSAAAAAAAAAGAVHHLQFVPVRPQGGGLTAGRDSEPTRATSRRPRLGADSGWTERIGRTFKCRKAAARA